MTDPPTDLPDDRWRDPPPDTAAVRDALTDAGAVAFVHAGRAGDPDLRYLVRAPLPGDPCAYLLSPEGDPTVVASGADAARLRGAVDARVESASTPGAAVESWLADRPNGPVLAPRHLPHDVALRVERAGGDLRSTAAVADARARKTTPERDRVERVTRAARRGIARAREVLDGATTADGAVSWEGAPLSRERLRRRVASTLVAHGVAPGTTRVRSPADPLAPGDPVVVTVAPRGPGGYRTRLSRTLTVDGSGGPTRRAHVACEAARRVAVDAVAPGASVDRVRDETAAELGAFGVEPVADARTVHGVGLARHESPRPDEGATLAPGHVVVVAPSARVPDGDGTVRLADTLVVGDDGATLLTDVPTGLAPRP